MGATNKTTYYELPQYVQSDKPSYLGDFNGAMNTIDTAIHTNAVNIGINETNIANTNTTIGDLTALKTSVKTNVVNAINENVDSIGDLSSLETIVKTSVTDAINELVEKFDLSNITRYTDASLYSVSEGTLSSINLTVATNSDKSICKIYGEIVTLNNTLGATIEVTLPTNFEVSETFAIFPTGLRMGAYGETEPSINVGDYIRFNQNGTISLGCTSKGTGNYLVFFPFLIFIKDFGDIPSNNE